MCVFSYLSEVQHRAAVCQGNSVRIQYYFVNAWLGFHRDNSESKWMMKDTIDEIEIPYVPEHIRHNQNRRTIIYEWLIRYKGNGKYFDGIDQIQAGYRALNEFFYSNYFKFSAMCEYPYIPGFELDVYEIAMERDQHSDVSSIPNFSFG